MDLISEAEGHEHDDITVCSNGSSWKPLHFFENSYSAVIVQVQQHKA